MKKITLILCACMYALTGYSQMHKIDSTVQILKFQQDSTLRALIHADSVKVNKDFSSKIKIAKALSNAIYPVINAGEGSGVIPVKDPTEIPDTSLNYKLLFELEKNPDSAKNEVNYSLVEVARIINLHVASGIPLKKIHLVIVAHGGALYTVTNNNYYKEHFKADNPNIKLINELAALGAEFIACGQTMAYADLKRESLLPVVKVSLTAQTVLSSYQLKGYIKY
ncbi:MAG: DsrE family protein [Bacteroidia bacterium]